MSRPWMGYIAGATFALCATASAGAYAQTAASAQTQADADAAQADQRMEHHEARRQHDDGRMERHEARRVMLMRDAEGHHHMDPAEHLRTMLQLKPGQEAALSAYLAAVKPGALMHDHMVEMSSHGGPEGGHDGRHDAAKTTPERLAEMEKHMADAQAQARTRIDATRKFYAQLEPSQKKVFDEMPMMMIGPMGPMMMMHGPMKARFEHPPMPPMGPMLPVPPRS